MDALATWESAGPRGPTVTPYRDEFREQVLAQLLPSESAAMSTVSKDIGVSMMMPALCEPSRGAV